MIKVSSPAMAGFVDEVCKFAGHAGPEDEKQYLLQDNSRLRGSGKLPMPKDLPRRVPQPGPRVAPPKPMLGDRQA